MGSLNLRTQARLKRKKRIRKTIAGTQLRPRLCVFRSARHIYAQVVDDTQGQTLAAASSLEKAVQASARALQIWSANLLPNVLWKKGLNRSCLIATGFCTMAA
jgi:large subunit ribosomal protein L18